MSDSLIVIEMKGLIEYLYIIQICFKFTRNVTFIGGNSPPNFAHFQYSFPPAKSLQTCKKCHGLSSLHKEAPLSSTTQFDKLTVFHAKNWHWIVSEKLCTKSTRRCMFKSFPVQKQRTKENVQHRIQFKNDLLMDFATKPQFYPPQKCNSTVLYVWWGRVGEGLKVDTTVLLLTCMSMYSRLVKETT